MRSICALKYAVPKTSSISFYASFRKTITFEMRSYLRNTAEELGLSNLLKDREKETKALSEVASLQVGPQRPPLPDIHTLVEYPCMLYLG